MFCQMLTNEIRGGKLDKNNDTFGMNGSRGGGWLEVRKKMPI